MTTVRKYRKFNFFQKVPFDELFSKKKIFIFLQNEENLKMRPDWPSALIAIM